MIGEIICVGTELLLGDILNTNAQYLSRKLADLGVSVYYQSVVGDNEERLLGMIGVAKKRSDLIIYSGGLGPTTDDITKETVAKGLGLSLYEDAFEKEKLVAFFKMRGTGMTPNNLKQIMMPEGSTILINNNGTAPGVLIEQEGVTHVILPGPPNELIPMFEESVVPFVKKKTEGKIVSKTLRLIGIGESTAAHMIQDIIDAQTNPSIAPYAKLAEVHFRMTAKAETEALAAEMIESFEKPVLERLGEYVYTTEEKELETVIIEQLIGRGQTVTTAESCTGGLIASTLVNCAGVSEVFKEGIIAYDNGVKERALGVKHETLVEYGAVSPQTAQEMAQGMQKLSGAHYAIATTGIAGPSGGTKEKPVGLVYIAIAHGNQCTVKEHRFGGNRSKVRATATKYALILLHQIMNGKLKD